MLAVFAGLVGYVGYDGYKMYSLNETKSAICQANLKIRNIYYPYPDHRLTYSLYSDEYMPHTGELNVNLRNFWSDRLLNFDETRAFDVIIKDGKFRDFTNSYLLLLEAE